MKSKHMFNRALSLVLAFALVLTSFIGFGQVTAQAEGVLTVAEAIANNTGTGTVEAYIVGTTSGGSNGSATYLQQGPFTTETNIAIADSPTETDATKIMPVQLVYGTAVRADLNLKAHPENLGKKVRITGTLTAYYTVPGLKSPTAYEWVGGTTEPNEGQTVVKIAEAKTQFGQKVTVEGIITADNASIGGGKLSTFIQDETAGINVYAYNEADFPALKEGDKVRITGAITSYRGLTEIAPSTAGDVVVISQGNTLPAAEHLSLADLQAESTGEAYEGKLVQVKAFIDSLPTSLSGGGYNINIYDAGFNGTTLRVMDETGVYPVLQAGKWYDITAIVSQYNSYQLMPRKAADVALSTEQPPAPQPAERYASTIKSTVDGDTAHLNTPVLGATTVRFLSIDTPETNYNGTSQGYHGEAAKLKLAELLPAGTAVEVEVPDKPFDGYGRLLGHVHKGDLDVNKEMVRLGMAAPYFIWPNVEHFEAYAAAATEAIEAGRGIWDPANPLEKLPYEFRFEDRGGPDKYVGDFFTKKYVTPDRYQEIPVQNRLFFFTEQEALEAGFAFAPASKPLIPVQLLSINDLHGKIDQVYYEDINGDRSKEALGRMDYLATYLKDREAANPNTLIVHAGDAVGGSSPISALFQDEPTVEIMEAIGFDLGTVGNHELDEGTTEMLRLNNGGTHPKGTENYDGINFPMIASNIEYKATGEHVLPPYAIQEVGGVKIGFVGVVTKSAAGMVMPAGIQDIQFTDEATAVNDAVAELKAQGIKAIVVLAHMDAEQKGDTVTGQSADLANRIDDEVDVIFAAHNHKIVNGTVDGKLIVQAYEYGKAFVDVDLEIDPETQDIVTKRGEIVHVNQANVTPDATVAGILAKYENRIAAVMNQVVGYADIAMEGGYASTSDNALGNLIADSMRAAMNSDFAMMNGGGIRDNIGQGPITWGELFNILPFNNVLMTLEIKGKDLYPILNQQLSSRYGGDYSISGLKYVWDPATIKVTEITLPDGTPIDPEKTYTLTTNNYMATSTSYKYRPIGELGQNPVTGPEDLEAFVAYVESYGQPLSYEMDGRITQVKAAPITATSVEEARQAGIGNAVTFEGTVSSAGVFGNKSFYVQDATGGLFVYNGLYDVQAGDIVRVTGFLAENGGELRLTGVSSVDVIGHVEDIELLVTTADQIGAATAGQLAKLKFATVYNLQQVNPYGTFEFTAKQGEAEVKVLVDYRTGLSLASLQNGDVVDLRGISSVHNGVAVLKVVDTKGINVFPNSKKKS